MPDNDFYLLIILSVVTGLLLIKIVMARIGRHQKSRRLEREIGKYFSQEAAAKNNWKVV